MNASTVDIVLPCYNPNSTWHQELISFYNYIKEKHAVGFVIVNDGSSTGKIEEQIKIISQQGITVRLLSYARNMGKGHALRHGVAACSSKYTLFTDIDFPFTNSSMAEMLDVLTSDRYNITVGYRDEKYYDNNFSFFRKQLSKAFRLFIRKGLRMPITDTQCGLKGFDTKGKEKFLATKINRYLFDFEFIYSAVKDKSLSIKPVPVQLKGNVVFSTMRLRILFQESMNLLSVLLSGRG